MNNAVEKWEHLGVMPPRDELQVPAVGLSAERLAVSEGPLPTQAAVQMAATNAMPPLPVEPPPVIAAEPEPLAADSQKHFRVEAAHTTEPFVEIPEEVFSQAAPSRAKPSQLSQRMQQVQETCARLLPIKGRSSSQETTSTAGWIMKLMFHPEAVVVLLLIVACFLAIVILDNGDSENAELAVAPEASQSTPEAVTAPTEEPVAEAPLAETAPVVPQPANVTAPSTVAPVADAPLAAAPVVSEPAPQAPAVPSTAAVAPPVASEVPQVAQALPPVAQSPVAAPSASPLTITEANTPPIQNQTIVNISPHANTHPITAGPPTQQPANPAMQPSMPPQAATNMPAAIDGRYNPSYQANVWPQGGAAMFEGPPATPGTVNVAMGHPQPKRVVNHTYAPGVPAASMPAANLSAYPPTVAPELHWQPQQVAQRPPQTRSTTGAAQLQGIIQQPQSGNLNEHY